MKKFWKHANSTLDRLTNFILVVILLTGIYCIYDTLYLYAHTSDNLAYYFEGGKKDFAKLPKNASGWLRIDDTNINYPVMQGKDNDEYLNKDPFGEYSLVGSIFMDWRNDPNWADNYNLLYGHHMAARKMFGSLDDYMDKEFFKKHRTGILKTRKADYGLKIFAVMETQTNDMAVFGAGEDERQEIRDHIRQSSDIFEEPEKQKDGSNLKLLAMTTCQDAGSTKRLAVFATMKKLREPGTLYDPEDLVQPNGKGSGRIKGTDESRKGDKK